MNGPEKWEDIPKDLKIILLYHWVSFYTTIEIDENDITKFQKYVVENYDKVFDLLVTIFLTTNSMSATPVVACLRANRLEELIETRLDYTHFTGRQKEKYEEIRVILLAELVKTYFLASLMNQKFGNDDDDINKRTK